MLGLYRTLLRLYPASFRQEFGEEMIAVFREARADVATRKLARAWFFCRETFGVIGSAMQERLRVCTGFSLGNFLTRRFAMRSNFRFPKTTAVLMIVLFAGVVLAIEKARAVAAAYPSGHPYLPVQPGHTAFAQPIGIMFATVYVLAIAVWAVLFALGRSGVHRLAELSADTPQK